jgi:polyribonucleotide nucleotidyltransferase
VPVERIGEIIGPGGKTIRSIVERTGAKIDIEDDGTVFISSSQAESGEAAAKIISDMVREVEIGEVYTGPVTRILNFGAFVEILPGREGLIRISELDWGYVNTVEDVLKAGEEVTVKVAEIDDQGRINLSRKALLPKPEGYQERPPREPAKAATAHVVAAVWRQRRRWRSVEIVLVAVAATVRAVAAASAATVVVAEIVLVAAVADLVEVLAAVVSL